MILSVGVSRPPAGSQSYLLPERMGGNGPSREITAFLVPSAASYVMRFATDAATRNKDLFRRNLLADLPA